MTTEGYGDDIEALRAYYRDLVPPDWDFLQSVFAAQGVHLHRDLRERVLEEDCPAALPVVFELLNNPAVASLTKASLAGVLASPWAIRRAGPETLDQLERAASQALHEPDPRFQDTYLVTFCRVVAHFPERLVWPRILSLIEHPGLRVARLTLIPRLGKLRRHVSEVLPVLAKLAQSADSVERWETAKALTRLASPEAMAILDKLANDEDRNVARAAARGLRTLTSADGSSGRAAVVAERESTLTTTD